MKYKIYNWVFTFRYITGDLEKACQSLDPDLPSFCTDNPFKEIEYTYEEASVVVHIILKSLTVIGRFIYLIKN